MGDRPVNAAIHPAGLPINTSGDEVLQRPVEPGLRAVVGVVDEFAGGDLAAGQRVLQRGEDQVGV
ncbi:hypothetical protein AB0N06_38815, partial [Streptomyces sp. NPDC051020]|uniref:hypothetical protein n=1 Tax=Streptomyces sp. NPDC051020 TaxID=3155409 RepID=UPI0034469E10